MWSPDQSPSSVSNRRWSRSQKSHLYVYPVFLLQDLSIIHTRTHSHTQLVNFLLSTPRAFIFNHENLVSLFQKQTNEWTRIYENCEIKDYDRGRKTRKRPTPCSPSYAVRSVLCALDFCKMYKWTLWLFLHINTLLIVPLTPSPFTPKALFGFNQCLALNVTRLLSVLSALPWKQLFC